MTMNESQLGSKRFLVIRKLSLNEKQSSSKQFLNEGQKVYDLHYMTYVSSVA